MSEKKTVDTTPTLPAYMKVVHNFYNNEKISNFLDCGFVTTITNFFGKKQLIQSVLREIGIGNNILQIGATFGNQIDEVAKKVGYYGNYHLVDVSKVQIDRCKEKYKDVFQNMNFSNQNGLAKIKSKYDYIICFMLLHELPPETRKKMVTNMLSSVKENGKVIFIDYHKPTKNKFLFSVLKSFNRLYSPFTEDFLEQNISELSTISKDFIWNKSVMFDGCYQKVVAIKKNPKAI